PAAYALSLHDALPIYGKEFTAGEGSMSKLYAGEVAVKATEDAIQILGGAGYVREHPVEQWHRDSKIYTIFEGTSEIQRLVVARSDRKSTRLNSSHVAI